MFFADLTTQIVKPYPCLLKKQTVKSWNYSTRILKMVNMVEVKQLAKDGIIISEVISVSGRKFRLIQIREDLLQKQSHNMRLTTDEEFSKMEKKDLIEILKNIGEFDAKGNEKSFKDLLTKVKKFERTRYLACWHDDSSVGNHSHLLVTVNVLYDTVSSCQITNII